ncbi:hypothetical protein [Pseudoalteromonas rhizosphaerae]|uniref:hypothetical protein n=1 Tax=Pseudoalteromonas rhizosphaerae TaxID=2518973 RepID=UPI0012302894|nr:hypothetical protein [Pseudoalteromonas rhizosphaerae]
MKNLQTQIKQLEAYLGYEDFNHEAVLEVIESLNSSLEHVSNNDFDREELTDYLLSENDPLDNLDGISDAFFEEVREIQHAIINYYS